MIRSVRKKDKKKVPLKNQILKECKFELKKSLNKSKILKKLAYHCPKYD